MIGAGFSISTILALTAGVDLDHTCFRKKACLARCRGRLKRGHEWEAVGFQLTISSMYGFHSGGVGRAYRLFPEGLQVIIETLNVVLVA